MIIQSRIVQCFNVVVTLMILGLAMPLSLNAQGSGSNNDDAEQIDFIKDNLSNRIEKRAINLLKGHLNPNHFRISVEVNLNDLNKAEQDEKIPYFPYKSRVRAALEKQKVATYLLTQLLKNVDVSVFLLSKYDKKVQDAIEKLFKRALLKNTPIEIKVNFDSYEIDVPGLASDDTAISKLEDEKKDLEKERDDFSSQLTEIKAELDEKTRELFYTKEGLELPALVKKNVGVVGGIFAWIAGVILIFLVLSNFGKTLGTSIKDVAGSLSGLGDSLGELNKNENSSNDEQMIQSVAGGGADGGTSQDHDGGLQNRILDLRSEINGLINEETSNVLLEFLAENLKGFKTSYVAVAFLELLGQEKANQFFDKLGSDHQDQIIEFLKSGSYPKGKAREMIDVGEKAKTKIFAASYDRMLKNTNKNIKQKLIKLANRDIVEIINNLNQDTIPRFLLHLEPQRIGLVLRDISDLDKEKFEQICDVLYLLPSSEESSEETDSQLLSLIQEHQDKIDGNKDRIYTPIFEKIVTSVGEGLEDSVITKISENNGVVGKYLQENVISFGTFFKLTSELQEDLIDTLTNKNIAAIISEDESLKDSIFGFLSERRQETVSDELKQFENISKTELKKAVSEGKNSLVSKMKKKKSEGNLNFNSSDTIDDSTNYDNVA